MAKKAANVKTEANGEADALEQELSGKADKPGAPAELQLNLPCRFGSGGLPDGKCGLGVAFEIEHLTVAKAHALLVHRELSVRLLGGKAADEDPRQTSFVPDEDMPEIYATGTCKGMSANHKWVKIRLTFRDSDVDVETLKAIRARRGRFILEFSSAIPVPEKKAPKQGKRARAGAA